MLSHISVKDLPSESVTGITMAVISDNSWISLRPSIVSLFRLMAAPYTEALEAAICSAIHLSMASAGQQATRELSFIWGGNVPALMRL
jgi:hypothetical protein